AAANDDHVEVLLLHRKVVLHLHLERRAGEEVGQQHPEQPVPVPQRLPFDGHGRYSLLIPAAGIKPPAQVWCSAASPLLLSLVIVNDLPCLVEGDPVPPSDGQWVIGRLRLGRRTEAVARWRTCLSRRRCPEYPHDPSAASFAVTLMRRLPIPYSLTML